MGFSNPAGNIPKYQQTSAHHCFCADTSSNEAVNSTQRAVNCFIMSVSAQISGDTQSQLVWVVRNTVNTKWQHVEQNNDLYSSSSPPVTRKCQQSNTQWVIMVLTYQLALLSAANMTWLDATVQQACIMRRQQWQRGARSLLLRACSAPLIDLWQQCQ